MEVSSFQSHRRHLAFIVSPNCCGVADVYVRWSLIIDGAHVETDAAVRRFHEVVLLVKRLPLQLMCVLLEVLRHPLALLVGSQSSHIS